MVLILSAVTWVQRMTLKCKLKPANSGRFSCQPQPAERTKKLPCRDALPVARTMECQNAQIFAQRTGLSVVGIFENRPPTTEAQYFLKVEDKK